MGWSRRISVAAVLAAASVSASSAVAREPSSAVFPLRLASASETPVDVAAASDGGLLIATMGEAGSGDRRILRLSVRGRVTELARFSGPAVSAGLLGVAQAPGDGVLVADG